MEHLQLRHRRGGVAAEVEQDEVDACRERRLDAGQPVAGARDPESLRGKPTRQEGGGTRLSLDEHDLHPRAADYPIDDISVTTSSRSVELPCENDISNPDAVRGGLEARRR